MSKSHELNGIFIVDKPVNISCAKVVSIVKKISDTKKAGHTGTLDPFATGVMICCVNKATKLASFFLKGDKKYQGVLKLGVETNTQDSTGTVTSTGKVGEFSKTTIESVFQEFVGKIDQIPPVFSALKHKGTPLYKLARRGKPFTKPPRSITIYYINILAIDLPEISFEVSCSSGTYIRTLCADLGKRFGCGGHLKALTRVGCNRFSLKDASSLNQLKDLAKTGHIGERLISLNDALPDMPSYNADKSLTEKIKYGRIISKKDLGEIYDSHSHKYLKIIDSKFRLLAILTWDTMKGAYKYHSVFVD